jgi:hypothetical protein
MAHLAMPRDQADSQIHWPTLCGRAMISSCIANLTGTGHRLTSFRKSKSMARLVSFDVAWIAIGPWSHNGASHHDVNRLAQRLPRFHLSLSCGDGCYFTSRRAMRSEMTTGIGVWCVIRDEQSGSNRLIMRIAGRVLGTVLEIAGLLVAATTLPAEGASAGTLDRIRQSASTCVAYREDATPFPLNGNGGEPVGIILGLCRSVVANLSAPEPRRLIG